MPEYLAPGVYVEETSYRAKSIEGVATSTAGFVGQCRYGPLEGRPQLITSFDEFQRYFGSIEELVIGGRRTNNFIAHAVQLFFANGGKRVYIARIFLPAVGRSIDDYRAEGTILNLQGGDVLFKARFPGLAGNLKVMVGGTRSGNLWSEVDGTRSVRGLRAGDVVEAREGAPKTRKVAVEVGDDDPIEPGEIRVAHLDDEGKIILRDPADPEDATNMFDIDQPGLSVQKLSLAVRVLSPDGREEQYQGLSTYPDSQVFVGKVLRHQDPAAGIEPPADRTSRIYLDMPSAQMDDPAARAFAKDLIVELLTDPNHDQQLAQPTGGDGLVCTAPQYQGGGEGDSVTGLAALGEIDDIAIVAAPGASALGTGDEGQAVRNRLITHCENLKYRFAILSANRDADTTAIREARGKHDSTYAALYHPWLVVRNPANAVGQGRDTLLIPPDGAMAGIYARSDIERGVHKAPANEVVRNVLRFNGNINKGVQDVLNPEGINCLRFFEGRGYRVWGARTMSSDPEWTYINVRRLFIFLEHSIDRGTQWAVFEPNNEQLWLKIRLTIESFLYDVWRTGALMGTAPEEAYFVRCDRTTMSQGDLDNGRLVCQIGVAPTKPAEFVIFRIGQWTADASII